MNLVGGQEAVLDAAAQAVLVGGWPPCAAVGVLRIDRHLRLLGAEVGRGVDVLVLLRSGGHAEVDGSAEVIEDLAPSTEAGPVAPVDDDEIKEVRRELLEKPLTFLIRAPERLVDAEVEIPRQVGRMALDLEAGLACAVGKGSESVMGLIAKDHAVGKVYNRLMWHLRRQQEETGKIPSMIRHKAALAGIVVRDDVDEHGNPAPAMRAVWTVKPAVFTAVCIAARAGGRRRRM